jgi:DNA-binding response OmpR family regulator
MRTNVPKRILIVDDEPDLLEILSIIFKAYGYETRTATDGQAGLEAAKAEKPDLIIMDVMMPRMNGYEACRAMREVPGLADVPVIMLSAKSQQADKLGGIDSGADAYLAKPFDNLQVLAKVRELLGEPLGT